MFERKQILANHKTTKLKKTHHERNALRLIQAVGWLQTGFSTPT